ncbi:phospholipase D family protein [Flavobacterium sp.]|uniref:phospholipase D family protein n=1 Tax=Flavobacterium sp. TaxID=239 RepID=UPI0037520FB4
MSKFITGKNLSEAIYNIIWNAEKSLLIVSPFIKLDAYFKEMFDNHILSPKVHIMIVFGKNENELSKSLSRNNFDYFKRFLNISIIYVSNLHAKYYANEDGGVITSLNLYDYSFKNNIEYGVYFEKNVMRKFKNDADDSAWETSIKIAEQGEAIFIKRPVYEKKFLSSILGKNYVQSNVLHDTTERFYSKNYNSQRNAISRLNDFEDFILMGTSPKDKIRHERLEKHYEIKQDQQGYCIRTGERIPFNVNMPYSSNAYRIWKSFNNEFYEEAYCHKTGKQSFGRTSMRSPIL